MERTCRYDSPLGDILLCAVGEGLTGLWFQGQRYFPKDLEAAAPPGSLPALDLARRWLDAYFSGREPDFIPPLSPRGTAFQRAVWRELLRIPYGRTDTYGGVARRLTEAASRPVSPRAVGAAVGRNPVSLIIPCHRVLGADGALTGYAGGLWRKEGLLKLEAGAPDPFQPLSI